MAKKKVTRKKNVRKDDPFKNMGNGRSRNKFKTKKKLGVWGRLKGWFVGLFTTYRN